MKKMIIVAFVVSMFCASASAQSSYPTYPPSVSAITVGIYEPDGTAVDLAEAYVSRIVKIDDPATFVPVYGMACFTDATGACRLYLPPGVYKVTAFATRTLAYPIREVTLKVKGGRVLSVTLKRR